MSVQYISETNVLRNHYTVRSKLDKTTAFFRVYFDMSWQAS